MAFFALVHGSGDGGWAWHLVGDALRARGHEAVAPDLPTDRDGVRWDDCADAVVRALRAVGDAGAADDVVLVGHSGGGFVVPLAAEALDARLQVYVAGMVPRPGESAAAWFSALGWWEAVAARAREDGGRTGSADPAVAFYHDVPPALAEEAAARTRPTDERLGYAGWPRAALPDIPARYVVTAHDRFIPPAVQRRCAAERLGIAEPDEIASGHCANLSRPEELADLLVGLHAGLAGRR